MTDEERLHRLEKPFMDRNNIVTSGTNQIAAKYPPLPKNQRELSHDERLKNLETLHENFQIVGGSNVTVEGSLSKGFAICSTCPGEEQGGVPNIFNTINGACCIDGVCGITNEAACILAGGTYQGDGTDCDPNPCGEGCGTDFVTLCKCGYPPFHIVDCTFPFTDHGYSDSFVFTDGCSFLPAAPPCTTSGGTSVDPATVYLTRSVTQTAITGTAHCDSACATSGSETANESTDPSDCSSTYELVGLITCDDPDCSDCGCQDTHFLCFTCPGDPCVPVSGSTNVDAFGSVTDEYTTAMLISNAEALFIATYGDCPGGCVFNDELNEDETCVTVTCVPA